MKNSKRSICKFICCIALLSPYVNAKQNNNLELSIFAGIRTSDSFDNDNDDSSEADKSDISKKVDIDNGSAFGLVLAWDIDHRRQGELLLSHSQTDFSDEILLNDHAISVTYLHLGGNVITAEGPLPIYLSGGLGIAYLSPDEKEFDNELKPSAHLGLGVKLPITQTTTFRVDARVYATYIDGDSELFCSGGNCSFYNESDIWLQGEFNAGLTIRF